MLEGSWYFALAEGEASAASEADYRFENGTVLNAKTGAPIGTYIAGDSQATVTFAPTQNDIGQTVRKRMILASLPADGHRVATEVEYRFDFGSFNDNEPDDPDREPEGFSEFGTLIRVPD